MKTNLPLVLGSLMYSEAALGFGLNQNTKSNRNGNVSKMKMAKQRQRDLSTEEAEADEESKSQTVPSRRTFFNTVISGMVASSGAMSILTSAPTPSEAACLSGDDRPVCIGVYKVPMDDRIQSYIDTPEHLEKFAPDLKWVPITPYPSSPELAKDELLTMPDRLQNIIALVQRGDLNGAGVEILSIVPRITVDGRILVSHLENNSDSNTSMSMRAMRSENAHQELLSSLGSSDIVLGQALAGRLGSITVAQIQILEELNQAKTSLQELLRAIPDDL